MSEGTSPAGQNDASRQGPVATGGIAQIGDQKVDVFTEVLTNFFTNTHIHVPDTKLVELMTLMRSVCELPQEENRITIKTLSAQVEGLSAEKRELETENANLRNDRDREVEIERQKLKDHKNSLDEKHGQLDKLLKQFEDQQEEQEKREKSAGEAKLEAAKKMESLSRKIDELSVELNRTYGLYTSEIKDRNSDNERFRKDLKAQKEAHSIQLKGRQEEVDKLKNSQKGSTGSWASAGKDLELRARVRDWVKQCEVVEEHEDSLKKLKASNEVEPNRQISNLIEMSGKALETETDSKRNFEISLRGHYLRLVAVEGVSPTSFEGDDSNDLEGLTMFPSSRTDVTGDSGYKSGSRELIRCPNCRKEWNPRDSF